MQGEGRIVESDSSSMVAWNPELRLGEVTPARARYSRGFLVANPKSWFSALGDHWLVLFHSLGADLEILGIERQFELPAELWRASSIEVDAEPAFLAFNRETFNLISKHLAPIGSRRGVDVAVEYIERRLISSLERSWSGQEPMQCFYCGNKSIDQLDTEVAAYIAINFSIAGEAGSIWCGVGSQLLERLDVEWRRKLHYSNTTAKRAQRGDQVFAVSVELAELAVPPAMLIDYMRKGTIVDLETEVAVSVQVKVNGEPWAEGKLCRMRDLLAVEITQIQTKPKVFPESTTRVRVEIAQTELDEVGLREHAQVGAILVSDTPVSPHASLIISGENVASAMVGELGGNFAINVLGK